MPGGPFRCTSCGTRRTYAVQPSGCGTAPSNVTWPLRERGQCHIALAKALSQRQCVAEHAATFETSGQRADEVEGVDLDPLAVGALGVFAAGWAFEHELERLAVDAGPFGDDVGHQASVVIGGEVHRPADGRVNVDAVGPHVTREADVEQVLHWRPSDR